MSDRINVVLSDELYAIVTGMAKSERRTFSQMGAILIEESLRARGLYPPKDEMQEPEKKKPKK